MRGQRQDNGGQNTADYTNWQVCGVLNHTKPGIQPNRELHQNEPLLETVSLAPQ
jgi:hypothetical protein